MILQMKLFISYLYIYIKIENYFLLNVNNGNNEYAIKKIRYYLLKPILKIEINIKKNESTKMYVFLNISTTLKINKYDVYQKIY